MLSRRIFLKKGAFTLVSVGFAPSFLTRTAYAIGTAPRSKRLIAIFQRGAVDGLSVVVPFAEPEYYRARPTIAIPRPNDGEGAALDLNGFFGFNPRLSPLKPLWDRGDLAIVHACGSPDATRSHFDAQDFMETATPGVKSTTDGWLNRYLQMRQSGEASAFRAVALAQQLPRMLQGSAPAIAVSDIAQFGLRSDALAATFASQYQHADDRALSGTGREAFEAIKALKAADPSRYEPENGAEYPRSPFAQGLRQIAQLTKADVGLEVAFAELGGWDTHVNQGSVQGQLAARLDDFARSLAALVTDLGDRMADTVVLTMSEFGRAVNENGNRGTDHGHGNAMLVIGGGIRGRHVYGKWPGLSVDARYDGRDLAITTDFRDVFSEIVVRHLGVADPRPIFPGYTVQPGRFAGLFA